jgi:hypothetical protein
MRRGDLTTYCQMGTVRETEKVSRWRYGPERYQQLESTAGQVGLLDIETIGISPWDEPIHYVQRRYKWQLGLGIPSSPRKAALVTPDTSHKTTSPFLQIQYTPSTSSSRCRCNSRL